MQIEISVYISGEIVLKKNNISGWDAIGILENINIPNGNVLDHILINEICFLKQ